MVLLGFFGDRLFSDFPKLSLTMHSLLEVLSVQLNFLTAEFPISKLVVVLKSVILLKTLKFSTFVVLFTEHFALDDIF